VIEIKNEGLEERIDLHVSNLLLQIYKEKNIVSGNISSEQFLKFDNIIKDLTHLFNELIVENSNK
jgi:hypothetical protein